MAAQLVPGQVMFDDLQIGDLVEIVDARNVWPDSGHNYWESEMDAFVGKRGLVTEKGEDDNAGGFWTIIHFDGYQYGGETIFWSPWQFFKVEDDMIDIDESDILF